MIATAYRGEPRPCLRGRLAQSGGPPRRRTTGGHPRSPRRSSSRRSNSGCGHQVHVRTGFTCSRVSKFMDGVGQAITRRTSHVRPVEPARPVRTNHARPNRAWRAVASCVARERKVARPVSRRRAARPTEPPISRNCGSIRHVTSIWERAPTPARLCRVLLAFVFELPVWRCRRHRRV